MTEYEKTLAALPSPADTPMQDIPESAQTIHENEIENEIKNETEESEAGQNDSISVRHHGSLLKKCVIFLLVSVSAVVFGVSGFSAIAGSTKDSFPTRLMLGEFFGGADNILISAETEETQRPSPARSESNDSASADKPETVSETEPEAETAQSIRQTFVNDTLELSNETPYEPDMEELLSLERVIPTADELYGVHGEDTPLVLILHTHATEAYADSAADGYRSTDITKNVVSLGTIISDRLNESGINTIHLTTLFDEEDFTMAYYNASLAIRRTLDEYPSISYIIDIHRDSIESDGVYIAPTTETEEGAAQMMLVVGTDYGGSGHTTWRNNLSLAARLQVSLNEKTPALMRSINLRSASFNEQYTDGSLLLEIGACASTTEEAGRSAEKFADALISEIKGQ